MTRDQIIETMARGMFDACPPLRLTGEPISWDDPKSFTPMNCRADAAAALSALEAAGMAVVPVSPTVGMFAGLTRNLITVENREKGIPPEFFGAWALSTFNEDYAAMVKAAQEDKP